MWQARHIGLEQASLRYSECTHVSAKVHNGGGRGYQHAAGQRREVDVEGQLGAIMMFKAT